MQCTRLSPNFCLLSEIQIHNGNGEERMEILSELTDLSLERNPSLDLKHKSTNLRDGEFELT
jgi:hypothetical protein